MQITAEMVKNLRQSTGAGMMDCRKALTEADGDMNEAEKILKKMGLAAVAKRAERATESGRVVVKAGDGAAVLVSVACETDFVAKNESFKEMADKIAAHVLETRSEEEDDVIKQMVNDLIGTIKENMGVKKIAVVAIGSDESVGSYVHGDGLSGAIVKFKCDKPEIFSNEQAAAFMHDMALHVTAFNPQYLSEADVDEKFKAEQMDIFKAQVASQDKPDKVKASIVEGKYRALLKEICLMDQGFFRDEKISVKDALGKVCKDLGCKLEIESYLLVKAGV